MRHADQRGPLAKREVAGTLRALGRPPQTPPFWTIVQFGAWGLHGRRYEPRYWPGGLSGGDPASAFSGMRNILAQGPKDLLQMS